MARLPRLAESAAAIEREHPALLECLDQAIQLTHDSGPGAEDWEQVRAAVEGFVSRMLAHEAQEHSLLQQGFNEDFETPE